MAEMEAELQKYLAEHVSPPSGVRVHIRRVVTLRTGKYITAIPILGETSTGNPSLATCRIYPHTTPPSLQRYCGRLYGTWARVACAALAPFAVPPLGLIFVGVPPPPPPPSPLPLPTPPNNNDRHHAGIAQQGVENLLKDIVVKLCLNKPDDTLKFVKEYIEDLQQAKATEAVDDDDDEGPGDEAPAARTSRRGAVSAAVMDADDAEAYEKKVGLSPPSPYRWKSGCRILALQMSDFPWLRTPPDFSEISARALSPSFSLHGTAQTARAPLSDRRHDSPVILHAPSRSSKRTRPPWTT